VAGHGGAGQVAASAFSRAGRADDIHKMTGQRNSEVTEPVTAVLPAMHYNRMT
jgi:hypothetical protein